jgi:hypothetical protein
VGLRLGPGVPLAVRAGILGLAGRLLLAGLLVAATVVVDDRALAAEDATSRSGWLMERDRPHRCRKAEGILVCAVTGGRNGYCLRLGKMELQHWASETALDVIVWHCPPSTRSGRGIDYANGAADAGGIGPGVLSKLK